MGSAAAQTVPFDEILVYDDCSTDDTASVAEAYGATVISGDVNRGCSAGKNRLAERATADWLHFHDADDDITSDLVEQVKPRLGEKKRLTSCSSTMNTGTTPRVSTSANRLRRSLMQRDPVAFAIRHKVPNFGVYRRAAFLEAGGFDLDDDVLYNEDVAFHHRLALAGLRFDYEPALTCLNYRYGQSMSGANQRRCARAQVRVLEKTTDVLRSRSVLATYAEDLADKFWVAGTRAAIALDWEAAARAARAAAALGRRTPPHGGAAFRMLATIHGPTALRAREHAIRLLRPNLRTR